MEFKELLLKVLADEEQAQWFKDIHNVTAEMILNAEEGDLGDSGIGPLIGIAEEIFECGVEAGIISWDEVNKVSRA